MNVATLVFATIVECFNEKSIFKATTKKQNEKYWRKRVNESLKAYVYSTFHFVISAVFAAIWDIHYAQMYYHDTEFHYGRFVILLVIYLSVFDTMIYWYHRVSHMRSPIDLYNLVHWYHHQFNPVTSYATVTEHPVDSVVFTSMHFAVGIIMSRIYPFDALSHQVAGLLVFLFNIVSHDETFFADHMTHHDTVNYNFGVGYCTFWDKICNTYKDPAERRSSALRAKRIGLDESVPSKSGKLKSS